MNSTAHHELGVLLHPDIEYEFAAWVDEAGEEWSEKPLFRGLALDGNVLASLRGAAAVTATLALAGDRQPGTRILDAFDRLNQGRRSKRDWLYRITDADRQEMPECPRLANRLSPDQAAHIVETAQKRFSRELDVNRESPRAFAALLAAVSRVSGGVAQSLIEECENNGSTRDMLDSLLVESDLFEQAEVLGHITQVENRAAVHIVTEEVAENLYTQWMEGLSFISNPRLLSTLINASGNQGRHQAERLVDVIDADRLRYRLSWNNRSDTPGYAALASVLLDLKPQLLRDIVDPSGAAWLLQQTPLHAASDLSEALIRSGIASPERSAAVLSQRLVTDRSSLRNRSRHKHWLSVGWIAWTLGRLGGSIILPAPPERLTPKSLDPQVGLWSVAWLRPDAWTADTVSSALARLQAESMPPQRPWAAAACLASCAHLHKDHELASNGDSSLRDWSHALDAAPNWLLALVHTATDTPADSLLRRTIANDWDPWHIARVRASLAWVAHDWRRQPLDAHVRLASLVKRR